MVAREQAWTIALAAPARFATALRDMRVNTTAVSATVEVTAAGTATLQVLGRHGVIQEVAAPVAAGRNVLELPVRLPSGERRVRVLSVDTAGRVASDEVHAMVGARLRMRDARWMIEDTLWFDSAGEYTRRCRRFGADRVDCEVRLHLTPRDDHCRRIVVITQLPSGQTRWGRYRCPRRRESLFDRDMRRGDQRPGRRSSTGGSTRRA